MALLKGRILTIANVGDSSAFLHNGSRMYELSHSHRLEDNKHEEDRLRKNGLHVAPLRETLDGPARVGEKGYGPLRVWPGGLAISRSIGDADVTCHVVSVPHIRQLLLPQNGARLILASDGVWDALEPSRIAKNLKKKSRAKCAERLTHLIEQIQGGELRDDATVSIIDILPKDRPEEDFKYAIKTLEKSQKTTTFKRLGAKLKLNRSQNSDLYPDLLADLDTFVVALDELNNRDIDISQTPSRRETPEEFTVCGRHDIQGRIFERSDDSSIHSSTS